MLRRKMFREFFTLNHFMTIDRGRILSGDVRRTSMQQSVMTKQNIYKDIKLGQIQRPALQLTFVTGPIPTCANDFSAGWTNLLMRKG